MDDLTCHTTKEFKILITTDRTNYQGQPSNQARLFQPGNNSVPSGSNNSNRRLTNASNNAPEIQESMIAKMYELVNAREQQTQANAKDIANMERQIAQMAEDQRKRDSGKLPRKVTEEDLVEKEGENKNEESKSDDSDQVKMDKEVQEEEQPSVVAGRGLLGTLPKKERDPGSLLITVTVGDVIIRNTLMDLGASVNVLPGYVYDKCKNEELEPAKTVGDFFYPIDFRVMEYESLEDAPALILGRPFLATAGAVMDWYDDKYLNNRPLMVPKEKDKGGNQGQGNGSDGEEILWEAKRHPLSTVDKIQLLDMLEMMELKHQQYEKDTRCTEEKVFQILDAQQQWISQVSDRMTQLTTLLGTLVHDFALEMKKMMPPEESEE
ncbi:hypothetical protein L2E82_35685 [Cichorium intybus]|uniref:Uncharacterized protein n=1 Tax=Cichorium intybus TaxID=13427 RepID=A0ACB9BPS2_CICIN|nr:hypothetical protein L2E82_35685 [Cichorium intybus]